MLKISLPSRINAILGLLLLLAGCAGGESSGNSDNGKNGGFYGSVIGGGSHP